MFDICSFIELKKIIEQNAVGKKHMPTDLESLLSVWNIEEKNHDFLISISIFQKFWIY